jgi:uncharacterized membrane protein (UPF0127 family)
LIFVSQTSLSRGFLALAFGLLFAAPATADQIPRMDSAHCKGQPEIKPLQPLAVMTSKGPAKFMVEFADTDRTREYGLMCRRALAADRGMLFDFKTPVDGAAFWMRNTLIPLDIIYIKPDGTVLSIARNVPALDESPVPAGGRIRAVLELASGRAAQLGILPGDRIVHRIFQGG